MTAVRRAPPAPTVPPHHNLLPLILLLVVVTPIAEGRKVWEPTPPWTKPNGYCRHEYKKWVGTHTNYYAVCLPSDATLPPDVIHASDSGGYIRVDQCVESCFENKWDVGTLYIYAYWFPRDRYDTDVGKCYCHEQPVGAVDPPVTNTPPALPSGCRAFQLKIPLGCMWTGRRACVDAPGPPHGCMWMNSCCYDALGYRPTNFLWPPPWWVWTGCGFLILLGSATFILAIMVRHQNRRLRNSRNNRSRIIASFTRDMAVQEEMDDFDGQGYFTEVFEPYLASLIVGVPEDTDMPCCICLEDLKPTKAVIELRCQHRYHHKCIEEFVLHQVTRRIRVPKCPTCRAPIHDNAPEPPQNMAHEDAIDTSSTGNVGESSSESSTSEDNDDVGPETAADVDAPVTAEEGGTSPPISITVSIQDAAPSPPPADQAEDRVLLN